MIPNSAVADSATITRLWARLPLRSLISISVLRHHRGLRGDHDPVAGRIADDRDPWLEEERNLDRHLAPAGRADAGAVPDGSGVWNCRGRRAWTAAGSDAGIDREREAATQFALNRGDHCRIGRERGIEWNRGPRALARGVRA